MCLWGDPWPRTRLVPITDRLPDAQDSGQVDSTLPHHASDIQRCRRTSEPTATTSRVAPPTIAAGVPSGSRRPAPMSTPPSNQTATVATTSLTQMGPPVAAMMPPMRVRARNSSPSQTVDRRPQITLRLPSRGTRLKLSNEVRTHRGTDPPTATPLTTPRTFRWPP